MHNIDFGTILLKSREEKSAAMYLCFDSYAWFKVNSC